MKKFFLGILTICILLLYSFLNSEQGNESVHIPIEIKENSPIQYVGKIKFDNISIRMIILRHTWDSIAFTDTSEAIQAVDLAASKGLTIKDIGDYNVTRNGVSNRVKLSKSFDFEELRTFLDNQMKVEAEVGDTFIIYTIGHGGKQGGLQTLGQRKEVMQLFAELAEKNQQETFWWQLSCYASADLPSIHTLTEIQKDYFSMIASSDAYNPSYFRTQGIQMEKLFNAMAEKSFSIDPNGDEIITAGELKSFLNGIENNRGNLLFARNDDEPIFGFVSLARRIPIVNRDEPSMEFPKNYIAIPRSRL